MQCSLGCGPRALGAPILTRQQHPWLVMGVGVRGLSSRRLAVAPCAAKGFGKTKSRKSKNADESGPPSNRKEKQIRLESGAAGPVPGQAGTQSAAAFNTELLVPGEPTQDDDEFAERLGALKEQARARVAEMKAASAASSIDDDGVLSKPVAVFDALPEDIYANPPPISQTLMRAASAEPSISDPKLRDAQIGPSQFGLAAGAIVLIAIFIIVSAGDYAPASKRYSGVRPAQQAPDEIEEKILKGKVSRYEDALKADPNNPDTLEALATAYARLLQYDKSAALLEKLVKSQPDDAEAWRLLGESSLLSQQPRKAVPAFERAVALRRQQQPAGPSGVVLQPDLQLLTGTVDAYIAAAEYAKGLDFLAGVRQQLKDAGVTAAGPAAGSQAAEALAAVAAAAASGAEGEAGPSSVAEAAAVATAQMLPAPELTGPAPEAPDAAAAPSTSAASAASEAAPAPAAPSASTSGSGALPPAVPAARPLDPVGVELLTAKVYVSWRGHDNDALAAYDQLIKAFPEDYRGYLAKGVYLRDKGRKADAERMFLQARFFAPGSKQQLVRSIAETAPKAVDLPDNN